MILNVFIIHSNGIAIWCDINVTRPACRRTHTQKKHEDSINSSLWKISSYFWIFVSASSHKAICISIHTQTRDDTRRRKKNKKTKKQKNKSNYWNSCPVHEKSRLFIFLNILGVRKKTQTYRSRPLRTIVYKSTHTRR